MFYRVNHKKGKKLKRARERERFDSIFFKTILSHVQKYSKFVIVFILILSLFKKKQKIKICFKNEQKIKENNKICFDLFNKKDFFFLFTNIRSKNLKI